MKLPTTLLIALALAALSAGASGAGDKRAGAASGARLQTFASCGELLRYVKRHAAPLVGAWGLRGGLVKGGVVGLPSAARSADAGAADDVSTTNVQEEGVGEPDRVVANTSHLFAVSGDALHAIDTRARRPRIVGTLRLEQGWSHELLLSGNRLLVLSRGGVHVLPLPGAARMLYPTLPSRTLLTQVDASDPSRLRVVRTLSLEADYVSARLVRGTVRVVTTAALPHRLEFEPPPSGSANETAAAAARNRAIVAASRVASWLPTYSIRNGRRGSASERSLVQCRQVARPSAFSGLGLTTVTTIDLDRGLEPIDSDAILSDGRVVYASPTSLYVATERWSDRPLPGGLAPDGVHTAVHEFDSSSSSRTSYRASGEVPGFLLDQWSLSEHEGVLRVASTEQPTWVDPAAGRESESSVTTFRRENGKLVPLGRVGGLGRGERIFGVRFAGDVAYVVTFRQVDPLYTLDLSAPRAPAVLGELKLLGYSAYLHPLAGDLLLGLGQDATGEGRALGTQLSLFDVSNLRRPARLQRWTLGSGSSEAETDHHAFLYWPRTKLVVVPVIGYEGTPFAGAVGLRVGRSGIEEVGRITHPGVERGVAPIRRSLVVGDRLFTVSEAGVKASGLASLADVAWLPFPVSA